MAIKIIGTGSYVPDHVMTNTDLERMVETSDEWIRSRTGIEERHIASPSQATSDISYEAAIPALEMAGIDPGEIDLILISTVTADKVFPSTACILQRKLKAYNAACLDIQAACSGFLYGIEICNAMMKNSEKYRKALIIGAEKLSVITNWKDRNTCVLFGDGAGAAVLEQRRDENDIGGITASRLSSNGDYENILHVPAGGSHMPASTETIENSMHFIQMEGQEVFKLAVNAMVGACREVLEESGVPASKVRWLIPHQANLRIILAVGKRLGIEEERVFVNVNKYGNTSAASVAIALDEVVRAGQVERGDYLLLTAFGAGLTWGANLLRW